MADSTDRRAAERMPVKAATSCAFAGRVVEDFGQAKIRDVSMNGVGLVVSRRVEIGSLLVITLVSDAPNPMNGAGAPQKFVKTLYVRVAHVTPIHGGFLVGGTFNEPLSYQEFTALVL